MWSIIVPSVIAPILAAFVMTGMESLARPVPFWEKAADVGWDLCILGVGITGGIFTNPAVETTFGVTSAPVAAVIVILLDLGLAVAVLHIRKGRANISRLVGSSCFALGSLAVGLPASLTFMR